MFKFLVISVLLCQEIFCQCSDQQPECPLFNRNKLAVQPSETKNYIFHGTNIQVYMNSASALPAASVPVYNPAVAIAKPPIRPDYNVTDGIGAHKLYSNLRTWNQARKACLSDGAQLAIIRSDVEQSIIVQMMMTQNSAVDAWLGLHDLFEEGDWVTVLGENLTQVGWAKWSSLIIPNPDNFHGKQHCARILRDGDGMDDLQCESTLPFICKISIQ